MSSPTMPHPFRHPRRSLLTCALASCLMLGAGVASAQSTSATLRGQVAGAGTDTTVTATNANSGFSRTVKADANGNYTLAGLPPGTYKVDVVANGAASSQNVTLAVGQNATLNVDGGGGAVTPAGDAQNLDAVQVTAAPTALIETRTSENSVYITTKQIDALPRATRNFLEIADTVPGVQFQRDGNGNTQLRSGATSANGTNVYIDGVSQKNYVLTGGVSGQDNSRGNPFPQSAVGEYKVISSNYKAEFDQLSSAAIVAATKSGTNDFHGSFFWDYSNDDWRAISPQERRDGQKADFKEEQYGATFSGPILKDRAHFFIAYEAKEYATPLIVQPGSVYAGRADELPENLRAGLGSVTTPFKEDLYFGKIDWAVGENHLFELTGKYRKEDEVSGIGDQTLYEAGSLNGQEEKRADLRWQYTGNGFLNDAHITYESAFWNQTPMNDGTGYVLSFWPQNGDEATVLNAGAGGSYQRKGQEGWSIQDDLTLDGIEWAGTHTLKMGVKFKDIELNSIQYNPYNPQFYYNIQTSTAVPYRVRYGEAIGSAGGSVISKNKQYGIYLQDDWEVNDKLTLNLGVRYDYEETPSFLNFQTPADVANALRSWGNLDNANYDIENYISNGRNRKAFRDAIQPRLGFSYDLQGNEEHVIYGGAGRAYDRNIFDYLALEQLNNSFVSYNYYFSSPENGACRTQGTNCTAWDPAYFDPANLQGLGTAENSGREIYLIDNNIKTPYSDQFSIGMRNLVSFWGQDWFTDVTLSRVESKDGFAFLRGNRREDGSFFIPGTTSTVPVDYTPPGYGSVILGTNGLETRNNSLAMRIEKPYTEQSGWGMTVSYTYSDAEENRQFGEHYSLDQETIAGYGWREAAGIAKNRLVATGIYDLPGGMTLSGKLSLASQLPFYGRDCTAGNDYCQIIQYKPDRSIGFKQFDLALSKDWDTGSDVKLNVRADVLNVFNWTNYGGYITETGTALDPNLSFGNTNYVLAGPMRTFRVQFGLNW